MRALTAAKHFWSDYYRRYAGDQWTDLSQAVGEYWSVYGGWRGFIGSPALWAAGLIALMLFPLFDNGVWADASISILPNVLGLSIGAMAVVLAFPTTHIFKYLSENGRRDSFYLDLASRLTHFIFVQVVALLLGLLGKAYKIWPVALVGCWALVYAILTAAVISLTLFRVAQIYNHPAAQADKEEE